MVDLLGYGKVSFGSRRSRVCEWFKGRTTLIEMDFTSVVLSIRTWNNDDDSDDGFHCQLPDYLLTSFLSCSVHNAVSPRNAIPCAIQIIDGAHTILPSSLVPRSSRSVNLNEHGRCATTRTGEGIEQRCLPSVVDTLDSSTCPG